VHVGEVSNTISPRQYLPLATHELVCLLPGDVDLVDTGDLARMPLKKLKSGELVECFEVA